MDRTIEHEKLKKKCLLLLSSSGYLVWSNNTGAIKSQNRYQTYGLRGSPDIIGMTKCGYFIGVEIKTGKAVQSRHQKNFQKETEKRSGIYLVIRSIEEMKDFING